MRKFTILTFAILTFGITSNVFALKENGELAKFLQDTGAKYNNQISDINSYINDIDFSLKQQLYKDNILRQSVIDQLPEKETLSREDFFRLFMEFKIGDKKLPTVTEDPFFDISKDDDFAQIASYLKDNDIFKGKLGNFEPQKAMTKSEMKTIFPGVEDIYISDQDEPLSLSTAINYFYRYFKIEFKRQANYTSPTKLSLDDQYFYNNGQRIEGILVHWHLAEENYSDKEIRNELKTMKEFGIIGVATEVPWRTVETEEGKYSFPPRVESLLKIAQEENMWVTLVLSPHYLPEWLDTKYSDDYKIKDKDLNVIKDSGFMNFSLYGPAVQHQLKFQKAALKHYSAYDNILAVYLSNEPGYTEDFSGDYSNYARSAYMKWCENNGFENCVVPENRDNAYYHQWQQFNRDSLTEYLNKTYESAKDELDHLEKFIPLSHKVVPYFMTNPHSANIALNITPASIKWDFIAADIYGYTPHIYDLLKGYKKPIMIAETNFIDGFDRQSFYEFLINQYLHGAALQTVYKWEKSIDKYSLFTPSGVLNENAHALLKATSTIDQISKKMSFIQPTTALVVPQEYLMRTDKEHRIDLDKFTNFFIKGNQTTSIIWSNDLAPTTYHQSHQSTEKLLANIQTLIIHPISLSKLSPEISFLDSPQLWKWIKDGGTLILPPSYAGDNSEIKIENGKIKFCKMEEC